MKKALLAGFALMLMLSGCNNMNNKPLDPDTQARLQRNESENEIQH